MEIDFNKNVLGINELRKTHQGLIFEMSHLSNFLDIKNDGSYEKLFEGEAGQKEFEELLKTIDFLIAKLGQVSKFPNMPEKWIPDEDGTFRHESN